MTYLSRHTLIFALLTIIAALAACRGRSHDPRLLAAADSIAANPLAAVTFIDSINPATLSADDRHYRDLLSIKARDKAYIFHTSDSLISSVLAWASDYGDDDILTEALYYGGRVYSDLGDYPSALRFFQDALDRLPPDRCDLNMRGNVLSQAASLFIRLKFYDQAIPYLKESIEIDRQLCDTFALTYDNEYLARIYLEKEEFDTATNYYQTALRFSMFLDDADVAAVQMELAGAYSKIGNIEYALPLLNGIQEKIQADKKIDKEMINKGVEFYNAVAGDIYYQIGIYDSVYKYSNHLIVSDNPNRQVAGYRMLLRPELMEKFSHDSLMCLIKEYVTAINKDYDNRSTEAYVYQNSHFNYSRYERENKALEQSRDAMLRWIYSLIVGGIIIFCSIIIILRLREEKKRLRLKQTLIDLRAINSSSAEEAITLSIPKSNKALEDEISEEISRLKEDRDRKSDKKKIVWDDTEAYKLVARRIKEYKSLPDKDCRWQVIVNCINEHNPDFYPSLQRLSAASLSLQEYHIASLIYIGFTTSDIAMIQSIGKSTVSYHRSNITKKLFGDKVKIDDLDSVLRSL